MPLLVLLPLVSILATLAGLGLRCLIQRESGAYAVGRNYSPTERHAADMRTWDLRNGSTGRARRSFALLS